MGSPRSRRVATSLVLLAAAALVAACGPRVPDTIKIGVAQPLSGPSAARGQDLVNGALLAAADINASNFKVAGKQVKFEIVPMDDKADKEEAKKVARALCDQKVVAVIGHLSSDVTEVTVPVYASGNVPQLFTSSAAELTKLGNGNAFRLIANDDLQAQAIASFAAGTLKANKVAILYEDTAYGKPLAKGAAASLAQSGKKVEPNVPIDNKTTSFGPFVAQLKAAKPDVLIALVRDNQLLQLFEQMTAAGLGDDQEPLRDVELGRGDRVHRRPRVREEVPRQVPRRAGLGSALRVRRGVGRRRHDPPRRVGRPGRRSRQAEDDRRDRAGDDDDALQRRRRAALRRDRRLPEAGRALGAARALGELVSRRGAAPRGLAHSRARSRTPRDAGRARSIAK